MKGIDKRENALIHHSIEQMLHDARSILLISHISPDGDAVGSILGMGLVLKAKSKQVQMVLVDGLPAKYLFLNGSEYIECEVKNPYDLSIALDCSDLRRTGLSLKENKFDINIDHHITNEYFASFNLVDAGAAATSEILAEYIPRWGFEINTSVANALLMGIITDTIGFRTVNTSPKLLRLAANLMEKGADITTIYRKALLDQSIKASLLWGFSLCKLRKQGKIIYTSITLEDRQKAGYSGKDDADLSNMLSDIADGEVSILFNEKSPNSVKVSWRSRSKLNVAKIAQHFSGGGHPAAAGAEVQLGLLAAQEKVLQTTQVFINKNS